MKRPTAVKRAAAPRRPLLEVPETSARTPPPPPEPPEAARTGTDLSDEAIRKILEAAYT
jgi:hypothetical protein